MLMLLKIGGVIITNTKRKSHFVAILDNLHNFATSKSKVTG